MMMSRRIALCGGLLLMCVCVLPFASSAQAGERRRDEPVADAEHRERLRALRDEMRREHQLRRLREQAAHPGEDERRELLRAWREDQERREAWRERREREGASRPLAPPPAREAGGLPRDWQRLSPEERRALRRELRDAYRER